MKLNEKWDKELDNVSETTLFKVLTDHIKAFSGERNKIEYIPKDPELAFRAFDVCNWNDLKLVIVASPSSVRSVFGGLSVGCSPEYEHGSVSGEHFRKILENIYGVDEIKLDDTFYSYARQGILFLPSELSKGFGDSHTKKGLEILFRLWRRFNTKVLSTIYEKKDNITFLIIGENTGGLCKPVSGNKRGNSVYYSRNDLRKTASLAGEKRSNVIKSALLRAETQGKLKIKW